MVVHASAPWRMRQEDEARLGYRKSARPSGDIGRPYLKNKHQGLVRLLS